MGIWSNMIHYHKEWEQGSCRRSGKKHTHTHKIIHWKIVGYPSESNHLAPVFCLKNAKFCFVFRELNFFSRLHQVHGNSLNPSIQLQLGLQNKERLGNVTAAPSYFRANVSVVDLGKNNPWRLQIMNLWQALGKYTLEIFTWVIFGFQPLVFPGGRKTLIPAI